MVRLVDYSEIILGHGSRDFKRQLVNANPYNPSYGLSPLASNSLGCKDFTAAAIGLCREAVRLLNSPSADRSPLPLVCSIARLRQQGWATGIVWSRHDSNRPADMIAKSTEITIVWSPHS
ncbi:hypothetical protein V6N11_043129 [Hibiscus sabdariffa]|uniref:RNase H type-1 domain-containing protein n=1 Tax=Hibiscus sabdariffa TaxID=183260 RepID=A0ABR2QZ03_9ROSI